jgi:hypothetical protein
MERGAIFLHIYLTICLAAALDRYLRTPSAAKDLILSAHEIPNKSLETEMEHVSFPRGMAAQKIIMLVDLQLSPSIKMIAH